MNAIYGILEFGKVTPEEAIMYPTINLNLEGMCQKLPCNWWAKPVARLFMIGSP